MLITIALSVVTFFIGYFGSKYFFRWWHRREQVRAEAAQRAYLAERARLDTAFHTPRAAGLKHWRIG